MSTFELTTGEVAVFEEMEKVAHDLNIDLDEYSDDDVAELMLLITDRHEKLASADYDEDDYDEDDYDEDDYDEDDLDDLIDDLDEYLDGDGYDDYDEDDDELDKVASMLDPSYVREHALQLLATAEALLDGGHEKLAGYDDEDDEDDLDDLIDDLDAYLEDDGYDDYDEDDDELNKVAMALDISALQMLEEEGYNVELIDSLLSR